MLFRSIVASFRSFVQQPPNWSLKRTANYGSQHYDEKPLAIRSTKLSADGKTLTLFGKDANLYAQTEAAGSIDQLIDSLRETYHRPLPAADLLAADIGTALAPLAKVANVEKSLPPDFIAKDGFGITEKARRYLAPLIRGEAPLPYKDGLPRFVRAVPLLGGTAE